MEDFGGNKNKILSNRISKKRIYKVVILPVKTKCRKYFRRKFENLRKPRKKIVREAIFFVKTQLSKKFFQTRLKHATDVPRASGPTNSEGGT